MEMREYDGEERRALNMIWTAAEDHSFHPEFMAFDRYGKADLYLNSIIGYVHRWYDGGKLSELFGAFQGTALQDIYDTIFWLGLECGAYEKEREGRPALEELRGEYWAQVLEESKWSAQEKLVQSLQTGWGRMVLGPGGRPGSGGFCPACPLTELLTPMKSWNVFPVYCGNISGLTAVQNKREKKTENG